MEWWSIDFCILVDMRYVYFIISTCTCSMWIDFMNTYNIYKIIINWPSFSNCVVGRCLTFAWTHHHLANMSLFLSKHGTFRIKVLMEKRHICSSTSNTGQRSPTDAWEGIMLLYGWACFKTYYFSDGWNWNSFHPKQMSSTKFEGRIRLILRRQFIYI